jgi:Ser/Thr protein kinase RdoA (MazF antagonist)
MRGSLGDKIGEGAFADVHAWAPGQVVKLFKASLPPWVAAHEARVTRAVFAAGGPAPEVLDEVTLEGRRGIVLPRLDGPTLMQLLRSSAVTIEQAGTIIATFAMSVHKTSPPPEVPSLRDFMDDALRLSGGNLPKHIATGILDLIECLSPGDRLCHTDLHPGNVIMTVDGPRLVDWTGTVRAATAFDLACTQIVLSELAPEFSHNPERPRAVNAAAQSEYARLAGTSTAELTAAMEPYLPIVRVRVLLGGAAPTLRERLIQRIEADLQ